MKFLTRLVLMLFMLITIYLWMRMMRTVPGKKMGNEEPETRKKFRKVSISLDRFLHLQHLRKNQLGHFCSWFPFLKNMSYSGPPDHHLTGLGVSHKLMTLYCKPSDVNIQDWEDLLLEIDEKSGFTIKNPLPVDRSADTAKSDNMFTRILQTYSKILFVADPFERLVLFYVQSEAGDSSFEDFVEDILKDETRLDGVSISSVLTQCLPCSVKYDYIVLLDSMAADMPHILRRIGVPESMIRSSFDYSMKAASRWLFKSFYQSIPKRQLRQLAKLYSWDFAAFPLRNVLEENRTVAKHEM